MSEQSEGAKVLGSPSNRVSAKWDGAPEVWLGDDATHPNRAFVFERPVNKSNPARGVIFYACCDECKWMERCDDRQLAESAVLEHDARFHTARAVSS